ncbi:MAG: hypothetical protein NC904_00870 [Candidatus Omnitrophica bacterium]|nr:hypothetical protein [Candidatus Omnitrophota bacterium]
MYGKIKSLFSDASITRDLYFIKYFSLIIILFNLTEGFLCIIIGIGMFRLRFWAWYLVIAYLIIEILGLTNTGFILGWQVYNSLKISIHIGLSIFILWFFMRLKIKEQFSITKERFKLKSWYSALINLLLAMTLVVPGGVVGYKILISLERKQPFLVKTPELIKLADIDTSYMQDKFRIREIFNLSFLVPEDFVLWIFDKNTGILFLGNITDRDRGYIMIEDKPGLYINWRVLYKLMRFENMYQFEEAIYSNNWGIILLALKDIILLPCGDNPQIRRYETSTTKGFVKYGYREDKDRWIFDCSVYDKFNNIVGNILLVLKREYFSPDEALRMISSIQIPRKSDAVEYYEKGLQFLDKGDTQNAQFAFANAYYYMPEKTEYGVMLVKTINTNDKRSLNTAKKF